MIAGMPAGVSWMRYLTFCAASLASALAGSQMVHLYYKPSLEIPEIPPNPKELPESQQQTGWRKYISIKKD